MKSAGSYYKKRGLDIRTRSSNQSAKAVANKALAVARAASKHELKYHNDSQTAHLMGPAGSFFITGNSTIIPGGAFNQRVGNSIEPTTLSLRLSTLYNPLASAASQMYRIIVYQSKVSGLAGAVVDYLQSANFYSMKSVNNRFNNLTLYDKVHMVSADNPQKSHILSIKIPKPIHYPVASGAPEMGAICILVISNEVLLANSPSIEGESRLFFHDK